MLKHTLILLLLWPQNLSAQGQPDPHDYDERIEYFQEKNQPDSILHYATQKALLAQTTDSLAAWAWAQLDRYYSLPENGPAAPALLDAAWVQRWREPTNAYDAEPLLYLQTHRGWHLFQQGRVWQSVQAYEQARQWYEQFQFVDFDAVETLYKPLGNHYTRLGDNEKALVIFQKSLPLIRDPASLAGLYCNIGIAHSNARQHPEAINAFQQGLALRPLPNDRRAQLLAGLAQAQLDSGQPGESLRHALEAARSPQPALQARAWRTAANACLQLNRPTEAETWLRRALAAAKTAYGLHDREIGKTENDLARLHLQLRRPEQALAAANRALQAILPDFFPKKLQDNPTATTFYEENTLWESLSSKAAAAEMQYHSSGDLLWLRCAAECHELARLAEARHREVFQYETSKLALQRTARERETAAMHVARLLFEKTGETTYAEQAFAIAERSKAALLLDALRDNLVRQRLASSDSRFGHLAELRRSRSFFEKNLLLSPGSPLVGQWHQEADALGQQIAAIQHALAADYPRLAEAEHHTSASGSAAARQMLAEGETLVQYFVSQSFVDVFLIAADRPIVWHRFSNDPSLQVVVSIFSAFFANAHAMLDNPSGYLQAAFALYQKILPPETVVAKRLLIVPDGFLSNIPFEALVTDVPGRATHLRNAPYLLRRQAVRYAWSVATLRQQNLMHSRAEGPMLAIAPTCERGLRGLPPLPFSRNEWSSLRKQKIIELIDSQANWESVARSANLFRVLHFSTHAFASPAGMEPPRLELYERPAYLPDIYALPLQADLVVLSACQTGLGAEQAGEGVMSLARAFAQSGTACVVSSLWTVNDRSTAQLFGFFYEKIGSGTSVCSALRQAKLAYIDDSAVPTTLQTPYFWAGLVAVGDDRSVNFEQNGWWGIVATLVLILAVIAYRYFWIRENP